MANRARKSRPSKAEQKKKREEKLRAKYEEDLKKHERIEEMLLSLQAELAGIPDSDSKIATLREGLFEDFYRDSILRFQTRVAAHVRSTNSGTKLNDQIGFFLWVLDTFPEARTVLPYYDRLRACPDGFRHQIRANWEDANHEYEF